MNLNNNRPLERGKNGSSSQSEKPSDRPNGQSALEAAKRTRENIAWIFQQAKKQGNKK